MKSISWGVAQLDKWHRLNNKKVPLFQIVLDDMQVRSLREKGRNTMINESDYLAEEVKCLTEILNEGLITQPEFEVVKKSLMGNEMETEISA